MIFFPYCYDEINNIIWMFNKNEILIIDIKNQETYFRKGTGYDVTCIFNYIGHDDINGTNIHLINFDKYLILDLDILYKRLNIEEMISKTNNKIIKVEKKELNNTIDHVTIEMKEEE